MDISLRINNLSKKFNDQWVLKSVNLNIYPYEKIAILGANGTGKSTLLKIIAGFLYFDSGEIEWTDADQNKSEIQFSYSAPYIDLFEQLTIQEHLEFHFKQKALLEGITLQEVMDLSDLNAHKHKTLKQLSSGIKQRFKNALAIFSSGQVLFLDEPTTNLDEENIRLYQTLLKDHSKQKMVLIASNNSVEYDFICNKEFRIENCDLQLVKNKQLWA
jgi:ABC-type multidrug transport system ATPase subunit